MTEAEEHITALFAKNPESWSKSDLARVIARYREAKALFAKVDPKTGEPKPERKKRKAKADPRQLDLLDLKEPR
jgi:hypothetical protein